LAKSLSFLFASAVLGILAVTITYFVAVSFTENPFSGLDQLLGYWTAIGLAVLASGGVFLLLGVLWRRSIILIVLYTFLWETLISTGLPSNVQRFSFVFYERAYVNSFIDRQAGFVTEFLIDLPGPGQAAAILAILGVAGLLASLWVVSYRDYNV
jgi:hypothetical protein